MKIYDIFCDASVSSSLRGACAGALITERNKQGSRIHAVIQPNGTNNSGEICALLLGVVNAAALKRATNEKCIFNIFSDSVISIKGVREWIFGWIANANKNGNNIFVNSEGKPVINQFYFKMIFNEIILNDLEAHFYHQLGHVEKNYASAAKEFQKVNGVPLVRIGLSSEEISTYNNFIDGRTRDILRNFLATGTTNYDGIEFDIIANTDYEKISDNMVVPIINVVDIPSLQETQSFAALNGPNIIRRYAKLVHALDYPSKGSIMKYIS